MTLFRTRWWHAHRQATQFDAATEACPRRRSDLEWLLDQLARLYGKLASR